MLKTENWIDVTTNKFRLLSIIHIIMGPRPRVVPHFFSGIVERAKREARENHPWEKMGDYS